MRQKVYLALPFILQPQVLILDEPTVYVDVFTGREMWRTILELSRDSRITVLLTTHNLSEAEVLCDRVFLFNKKKIVEGKPKEIIEKTEVLKAEGKILAKIRGKVSVDDFNGIVQKIDVQYDDEFTYLQLYFKNENLKEVLALLSGYNVVDVQTSRVTLEDAFMHLFKSN